MKKDEIIALLQQQISFLQKQLQEANRKVDTLLEEVTSLRNTLEHKSEEEARQKRIIKGLVKISENKSEKQTPAPASQDTPAGQSSEKKERARTNNGARRKQHLEVEVVEEDVEPEDPRFNRELARARYTRDVIRIDSVYFSVVGVNYADGNMNVNGNDQQAIYMPLSLVQQIYNRGESIDMICVTGRPGVTMSDITDRIRTVIALDHHVDPKDEKGVMVFNTEMMFSIVDNMFTGINLLIWLVGIGTLLAGAIGVSNIMMVTVRERTVEIGIRRAIGATPRMILSQIIQESILLTSVAGMSGILFVVLVLQELEMANTTDGVVSAHFQISFWTAIGAVVLLSVLGVLAGLAPAIRAMRVKPVDAMRDE